MVNSALGGATRGKRGRPIRTHTRTHIALGGAGGAKEEDQSKDVGGSSENMHLARSEETKKNKKEKEGREKLERETTTLMIAAGNKQIGGSNKAHAEKCAELIDKGEDPNAKDDTGKTASKKDRTLS